MSGILKTYLKPYWKQILLIVGLLLLQAIANLYLPELNADIINNGVAKGDTGYIWRIGIQMTVVTLLLGVCAVIAAYWGSKTAMSFGRDLRSAIFRKVESLSSSDIDTFGAASLITRNTNDVQQIQMMLVMAFSVMILAPIMMVGSVFMALRQDVVLSSMIAVVVPLMAVVIGVMLKAALPLFTSMQGKTDRVNQVMREKLSGIRVIRAFVRAEHEERRFDAANRDLTETQLKINRMFALMMPMLMSIMNFSSIAIIWFGAGRVDSGAMPIGNLSAFLAYIMQILMSVMMAVIMLVMLPRAAASAKRIAEVLDTEPSVVDPSTPVVTDVSGGVLEFDDVEFRYPGAEEPVLCGISFSTHCGQTTAIVGSTGSGKTTLINLIPRFYDVTGGRLSIGGVDVRDISRDTLWSKIGFIQQKAYLFSGTVASNLRYGKSDATDEELWHALEVAQGADFVRDLDGQLEAPISQGGTNVSGGQRQRLAIARALVKRPDIYVFDDSFSALDFKTDARLRAALDAETAEASVIIVAQRVSTIMDADQIVVLDGGRIVGVGTHAELMDCCDVYREIVYSQLTEEEVA